MDILDTGRGTRHMCDRRPAAYETERMRSSRPGMAR